VAWGVGESDGVVAAVVDENRISLMSFQICVLDSASRSVWSIKFSI